MQSQPKQPKQPKLLDTADWYFSLPTPLWPGVAQCIAGERTPPSHGTWARAAAGERPWTKFGVLSSVTRSGTEQTGHWWQHSYTARTVLAALYTVLHCTVHSGFGGQCTGVQWCNGLGPGTGYITRPSWWMIVSLSSPTMQLLPRWWLAKPRR